MPNVGESPLGPVTESIVSGILYYEYVDRLVVKTILKQQLQVPLSPDAGYVLRSILAISLLFDPSGKVGLSRARLTIFYGCNLKNPITILGDWSSNQRLIVRKEAV